MRYTFRIISISVVLGILSVLAPTSIGLPQGIPKVSAASTFMRLTNDIALDWSPRVDNGQTAWFRQTETADVRAVMFNNGIATREIARINADDFLSVYLEIDNGWVFWEDADDDDGDYEKFLYNSANDTLIQISDNAVYDKRFYKFENGQVLWETSSNGLMFFNGTETVNLAGHLNYKNTSFTLVDGCVVWEQGTTSTNRKPMLHTGGTTIDLTLVAGASGYAIHKFGEKHPERCTRNGQVTWLGYSTQTGDWEILFYNGTNVQRLTNDADRDTDPQAFGGNVAWVKEYSSLWLYDGTDTIEISNSIYTTSIDYYLFDMGILWWNPENSLMLYRFDTGSSILLQDYAEGYSTLEFPNSYEYSMYTWRDVPSIDDKGVLWYIRFPDTDYYTLKLYDGIDVRVLGTGIQDPLHNDGSYYDWGFTRNIFYEGGYAAWNAYVPNTVDCNYWVIEPAPGHYEVRPGTYLDREVFYHDYQTGEVRQITSGTQLNGAIIGDMDKGMVVWSGDAYPPPYPGSPPEGTTPPVTFLKTDIFVGGKALYDLAVYPQEIEPATALAYGYYSTVNATVHNDSEIPISAVPVQLLINSREIKRDIIPFIAPGGTVEISFQWANFWKFDEAVKTDTRIEVVVDPDDGVYESSESNNLAVRTIPKLQKGIKNSGINGRGFQVADSQVATLAVPIGIWFDDDARTSVTGQPTRYYNPIATTEDILNDIESDFNDVQFPNGIDHLVMDDFTTDKVKATIKKYWAETPGIIISDTYADCLNAAAPVASYLNWPVIPSPLLGTNPKIVKELIEELGVSYVLSIGSNQANAEAITVIVGGFDFASERLLLIRTAFLTPADDNKSSELFRDVLKAFGEKSGSIVVTNSIVNTTRATAALAAYYKAMVLDVKDVIPAVVSYSGDNYTALSHFNADYVEKVVNKSGSHDILGYLSHFTALGNINLFLVGDVFSLPFGIMAEPSGLNPTDTDKNWIATDYRYYHAHPRLVPGGRLPLFGDDNINYVARALQFAELPVGDRDQGDDWEDNVMGLGTYNPNGKRNWNTHNVWWLDSIVYHIDALKGKIPGVETYQFYEDPSPHGGGWGADWYRIDNDYKKIISEAPVFWLEGDPVENPTGSGNRGDGINNDNDRIGYELNNGDFPIERIIDVNGNGVFDEGDVILNEGTTPGIQATAFIERDDLTTDEEIWDGADNDGDGFIDEDCSRWRLCHLDEIYNELLDNTQPEVEFEDCFDLTDEALLPFIGQQGLIIYSGHGSSTSWGMFNLGGATDPYDNIPAPPPPPAYTTDNRTYDETHLDYHEIPEMSPSLIISSACHTGRAWVGNNFALEFMKKGALAFVGATGAAYGTSDEFRNLMLSRIDDGKLHIGSSFRYAVDSLDAHDLWAQRFGENIRYTIKTKYQFNLFGLGAVEIDPAGGNELIDYSPPVYDASSGTWSVDIIVDFPDPLITTDDQQNVTGVSFPFSIPGYYSDDGSRPALRYLPFEYSLPPGGRLVEMSQVSATVFGTYDFSQYQVEEFSKNPEDSDAPKNPQLYQGTLYPDVLFVNGSEFNDAINGDHIFGSVAGMQVDGTLPVTTVYDQVVLRMTYTTPLKIAEVHVSGETTLDVTATVSSTDGNSHTIVPVLTLETAGGVVLQESIGEEISVGDNPETIIFQFTDVDTERYIARISAFESGVHSGELCFEVGDFTGPVITAVSPDAEAIDVSRKTMVSITFSEPMDKTATESAFSLFAQSSGTSVNGTCNWTFGDTVMTFDPANYLDYSTEYLVFIGTGARDASGNNMQNISQQTFTTVAQPVAYTLTLSVSPPESGTTNPSETSSAAPGDTIDIHAIAGEGYVFHYWSGDVSTISNINMADTAIMMEDTYTITANFIEGTSIQGVTHEVKGNILGSVTLTMDETTSVMSGSEDGVYLLAVSTTGMHNVAASKAGYRGQAQTVDVTDLTSQYTLDFKGTYGLIPNAPNLSYALACINKWKYPPSDGTELEITKVLSVINAWKFPVDE